MTNKLKTNSIGLKNPKILSKFLTKSLILEQKIIYGLICIIIEIDQKKKSSMNYETLSIL